jgi:glycerophosphoryl diester phosphodiesterase
MSTLNIAHRGGAGLRPENTLAAFAHAIALGADGAELDAQMTRDGHVVVFHDFRLKPSLCRSADGRWVTPPGPRIVDLTLAELRGFDVGRARPECAYARSHPDLLAVDGERIPRLSEVVALARAAPKRFTLFVELKSSFEDRTLSAPPERLADAVLDVLDTEDFAERTVLVGFDWPGLIRAGARAPSIERWFTTLPQSWFGADAPPPSHDPPPDDALAVLRRHAAEGTSPWAGGFDAVSFGGSILEAIRAAGGAGWFPWYRDATPERVAEARAMGLKVGAWTVNDQADMGALGGLDALCTDRPDVLREVLGG